MQGVLCGSSLLPVRDPYFVSLLLLFSNDAFASQLADDLAEMGWRSMVCTDVEQVLEQAAPGVDNVLLSDLSTLTDLREALPIPSLLISDTPLTAADLSRALQVGVADALEWSMEKHNFAGRLEGARDRFESLSERVLAHNTQLQSQLADDQRVGQFVQMSMLPPDGLQLGKVWLERRWAPSLLMSGDFIDYYPVGERYALVFLADVSGHGAASAFVTVLLKNHFSRLANMLASPSCDPQMLSQPGLILAWLNEALLQQGMGKHVALFCGVVDHQSQTLSISCAAQFPPPLLKRGEQVQAIEQAGKPLGLFAKGTWQSQCLDFGDQDHLLVFTDGVMELLEGENLAEKEAQLHKLVQAHKNLDEIWLKINRSQGVIPDDISCLSVSGAALHPVKETAV